MANESEPIAIRDIDVPFWRIVMIIIKWSIAAIPAAIVIAILYALIFAILGGAIMGIFEVLGIDIPEIPTPPAQ